ncbi:hypothetical protein CHLNCDRAFT_143627 [Chlorella variabilis]|uniref:UspA domain-containing protein n=1 Tax=Chlorella variabilis TaxID=554065 RepID=E1ZA48_CHLVA|nr:hypothetical protein CHLNCDRAFT_143627 [Chlorella variabilis]EFN56993.1 hypothetical protein CHLNCDRAFT_143627 [Chlorella variabilis]|eukprot:XP_005849095.1 hypothetical protein CHLNCDRAFT_143627 [Chlorella variabilis]
MSAPAGGEGAPGEEERAQAQLQRHKAPPRALLVCAEDTAASAAAAEWALENLYRDGDVVHMTYVVRCLIPSMEVFHGLPGTAYSFSQPGQEHKEQHLINDAKKRLEARFLPLLRPHLVPYQLHLYAERCDCSEARVCELIMQDIEQRDAALPGTQEGIGSVADYLSKNCRRPTAIVRPHTHVQ